MDKNKIIQNAQKYIQKGQIDKAIKEYTKIVEADPKDVRTRLKIGDLHAKKGANREAASTYMKVAEAYGQQGFFLKAVAVYKQILKLQPDLIDVNVKLAELYHQLGLMSDAMAQYQTVVGYYEAAGDMRSSFATLKKMLDLDPDNVASRIKLAEMYSKENMVVEAVEEFRAAAAWLKERNRIDDYVKVLERLVFHQPEDIPLTRELANIYLAKGDTKRSLAKLQICFKADPRDVETLHLLGQAFLELGQTSKTVSVYKELAKIHGDAGRLDEQRAAYRKVLEVAPGDPDAQAALAGRPEPARAAPASPAPGRPPGAAPAAGPPPGVAPAAGPPPGAGAPAAQPAASSAEAVVKLLTETDVYMKYGLHDKALEHLKKVFSVAPTNLEAHEKAKDLFIAAGNTEAAGQELVTLVQLTADADPERARAYLKELMTTAPHLPEVKAFVEKLGAPEVEEISFLGESGPTDVTGDEEVLIADAGDEILIADDGDGFTEEVVASDDEVFGLDMAQDEGELGAAIEIDEAVEIDEPSEVSGVDDAFVIDDDLLASSDLDSAMAEAAEAVGESTSDEGEEEDRTEMLPVEEVPELVAAQDGDDLDDATIMGIPDLETGPEPAVAEADPAAEIDLDAGAEDLGLVVVDDSAGASPEHTLPATDPVQEAEPLAAADDDVPEGKTAEELADELEEAEFFLQQGLPDEAREVVSNVLAAAPDHPQALALLAQIDAGGDGDSVEVADIDGPDSSVAEPMVTTGAPTDIGEAVPTNGAPAEAEPGAFDDFDLAGELADELAELEDEETGTAPLQDFQVSADDVFAEFKKGVAKAVSTEDADTHYDLGIAYREMGLTQDAIGEFELAAKQDDKRVDALTMIGQCQRELGNLDAAIAAYGEALTTDGLEPDAVKAVHYDMGTAYEEQGRAAEAAHHYEQTIEIDPKFRDAKARLEALGDVGAEGSAGANPRNGVPGAAGPAAEGGSGQSSKTGKVGYL